MTRYVVAVLLSLLTASAAHAQSDARDRGDDRERPARTDGRVIDRDRDDEDGDDEDGDDRDDDRDERDNGYDREDDFRDEDVRDRRDRDRRDDYEDDRDYEEDRDRRDDRDRGDRGDDRDRRDDRRRDDRADRRRADRSERDDDPAAEDDRGRDARRRGRAAPAPLDVFELPVDFELKGMSLGSYPALVTTVRGASEKLAAAEWKRFLREYGGRAKRSKPEALKAEQMAISSIGGADLLDVYADFSGRGDEVKVYVWLRSRGDFVSEASGDRDVDNAVALVQEFHAKLRCAAIAEELEGEAKDLDKLQKRLSSLQGKHRSYESAIERARKAIEEAERNIETNLQDQQKAQRDIEDQTEEVEAVRSRLAEVKC